MNKLMLPLFIGLSVIAIGVFLSLLHNPPDKAEPKLLEEQCKTTYKGLYKERDKPGPNINVSIGFDAKNNKCTATCNDSVSGYEFDCSNTLVPDTVLPDRK